MAVIDPYRVVVIATIFLMWTIIAYDHVFNPSSWTKIFFDLLTQGKLFLTNYKISPNLIRFLVLLINPL